MSIINQLENLYSQNLNRYKPIPFWSWNDELDEEGLCQRIEWMNENGVGGFFMHARGGLKTEYLGEKWFECIKACSEKAEELGMEAYAYDENGWPSGFVGGKLLEEPQNHDKYLTYTIGEFEEGALVNYLIKDDELVEITPENIRLRKRILNKEERMKYESKRK